MVRQWIHGLACLPWHAAPSRVLFTLALGLLIMGVALTLAASPSSDSAPPPASLPAPAALVELQQAAHRSYGQPNDSTPTAIATATDAPTATPSPSPTINVTATPQPAASPPTHSATETRTPTLSAASVEQVTGTILPYIEGELADDPLLEIQSGVWVKTSNYHGVTIDNAVYYYDIVYHQSFDPLRRGAVADGAIQIVTTIDDGDFKIVIYRITDDARLEPATSF